MPNESPPMCLEYESARACSIAADLVVVQLKLIALNSDVGTVSGLARETLKLAETLKKRAADRWRTVSTKFATQGNLLDGGALADQGDSHTAEVAEEIERLGGVR